MSRPTIYTPRASGRAKATCTRGAVPIDEGERAQLLATLRANQQLLRDLMLRYDRGHAPAVASRKRGVAPTIRSPEDVLDLFGEEMSDLVQEQLRVLLLDTKHRLMRWEVIYQGTVDAITVRPAELLRPAVLDNAPAVLLVHNHPSGDPTPSPEDVRTTEHTMSAGDLLSIDVLDHVVLGKHGTYATIRGRGLVHHRTEGQAA